MTWFQIAVLVLLAVNMMFTIFNNLALNYRGDQQARQLRALFRRDDGISTTRAIETYLFEILVIMRGAKADREAAQNLRSLFPSKGNP